MVLDTQRLL